MQTAPELSPDGSVSVLFADVHRELRRSCERLLARASTEDCPELVTAYRRFERHVLRHLAVEEELLLPLYEQAAPGEAATIRARHAELRHDLERLCVDTELHIVRTDLLHALVERLDQTARHEEETLYSWARHHLPPPQRATAIDRIADLVRELVDVARARSARE